MKKHNKVKETIEKETIVEHRCDFCDRDLMRETASDEEKVAWDLLNIEQFGSFHSNIQVKMSLYNGYPESSYLNQYELDVCIKCFITQIMKKSNQYLHIESET